MTKRFLAYLGFRLNLLTEYTFTTRITGTRGFEEAKVCSGGIQTQGLQENFEVKIQPGLFIIGECLDCTGKTGGFNLQRCRTSGAVCGKEIASKDNS
ncbi:MAG: NAD(P)/FAD-dependent oxidoreductase [Candidatus Peribacteria bacterium]|nr:NAD(P)/FAD-dependent oxidoreductase [Candidatus Peribacteria bacterium]